MFITLCELVLLGRTHEKLRKGQKNLLLSLLSLSFLFPSPFLFSKSTPSFLAPFFSYPLPFDLFHLFPFPFPQIQLGDLGAL